MAGFDEKTVKEEVVMLGGMIEELDNGIETAHESKRKLISIRTALASAIGMELPVSNKDQLNLTFVVNEEAANVSAEEK